MNIYGNNSSIVRCSNHTAKLLRYVEQFCLGIEKHIFPDIHYGKIILNFTASRDGGFNAKGGSMKCMTDVRTLPGFNVEAPKSVLT